MSETTPLLQDAANESQSVKDVYNRFSSAKKRVILTLVSPVGLLTPFSLGCFLPCVPQIAQDLNVAGTVINYAAGAFILNLGIGTLVCAPYAGFYGRRPVYLVLLPIFCVGGILASTSVQVVQLGIGCALQGFGASCFIPVGAAIVSDIYRLEERGTAMGRYFGIVFFGLALAPIIGGLSASYLSWRATELILFAMGFVSLVTLAMYLPETSHPGTRGIDKLSNSRESSDLCPCIYRRWKLVWLNPLTPVVQLLRSPNIFLVALASSLSFVTNIVLRIPLPYTLGPRYGITGPAFIGLCYLPTGLGHILGAMLGGHLSDRAIVRRLHKHKGQWHPEDRLEATLLGASLIVPLSVLTFGLTTQFVPGRVGIVINLICLFMNGMGVQVVLSPSETYVVDILRDRGAEVLAVTGAFRNIVSALTSASVLPAINMVGVAFTNGLAALIAWFAFGLLLLTIRYGARLRAWIHIGYTTMPTSSS